MGGAGKRFWIKDPRAILLGAALLAPALLAGCAAEQDAAPPPQLANLSVQPVGGRLLLFMPNRDVVLGSIREQQQALDAAQNLKDVRLYELYDDPALRQTLHRILKLQGAGEIDPKAPAALFEAWQEAAPKIKPAPAVDPAAFADRVVQRNGDLVAALEASRLFDEVKVVESYSPGFERVAFGESGHDYMLWQEPDYAGQALRWHMINKSRPGKREIFVQSLEPATEATSASLWLGDLSEKAAALAP